MSIKSIKSIKTNIDDFEHDVEQAAAKSLHDHWFLYVVEGLVLVVLGIAAIAIPPLAMIGIAILLGWLFLISGVIGLITTLWLREGPGFGSSLLSAVLGIAVGLALFVMPVEGAFAITILLVVFFVIEGATSIVFALEHRRQLSGKWEWMLASGVIDLILGTLIVINLPSSTAWVMGGLLVGINMLIGGIALTMMGLHARNEAASFGSEAAAGSG
jgi:uncharacterized membrane protein HdeD (DUF308 family)